MKTLAGLIAFVGSIALGIVASNHAGRYAGLGGVAFDNWMLAGFVLSIALGCYLGWKVSRSPVTSGPVRVPGNVEAGAKAAALREALLEKREARAAQLRADPSRAQYADRVSRGEDLPDATLAYWENPGTALLCEHLRDLEQDLRAADPTVAPTSPRSLRTRLKLRFPELQSRYALPAFVTFEEEEELPGRGGDLYQGEQWLQCTDCNRTIQGSAFGLPFPAP